MGKVLIEKMLRSCPKVNSIYMLLRPKKDKTIDERLDAIKDLPLFRLLKQTNPDQLKKIIPVNGDACLNGMGISNEDLDKMRNVSIIFHSAASVRWDIEWYLFCIYNLKFLETIWEFTFNYITSSSVAVSV